MAVRDRDLDDLQPIPVATRPVRASVVGSMLAKVAEMVTLLLLATIVPRALGSEGYGRFAVPLTIVTLGSLALSLGGPLVLARFVPAAPPAERVALARAIGVRLARGRAIQVVGVAVLAGGAALLAPDRFPRVETTLVVLALALGVATTLALQVPLGLGRTGPWTLRYPLQNVVLIAASLGLHHRFGDRGAVVGIVVSTAVALVFALVVLWPIARQPAARVAVPDGALRFGVLQAAGAAMLQAVHRGGVVVVAVLGASSEEAGFAALAGGIALAVTYAVLQAYTVSLPHLAERTDDSGEPVLRRLSAWLLAGLVPVALVGVLLVDRLVPVVFGDDFEGAVAAFGPALALIVLAPVGALVVQVAALRLRPQVALVNGAAALVTFVVVAVLAVPAWDAAGASLATLAGVAVGGVVSMRRLPGAVGAGLAVASYVAAAGVLALAVAT